jgi:transposase
MTREVADPPLDDIRPVVGLDFGINFWVTAYDSQGRTTFFPGRAVKVWRAHFKILRQNLQRQQTPSARRRLQRLGQREHRWMTDVNHQVSQALVVRYGAQTLFVGEDLTGSRGATERVRRRDRYTSVSWPFSHCGGCSPIKRPWIKPALYLADLPKVWTRRARQSRSASTPLHVSTMP